MNKLIKKIEKDIDNIYKIIIELAANAHGAVKKFKPIILQKIIDLNTELDEIILLSEKKKLENSEVYQLLKEIRADFAYIQGNIAGSLKSDKFYQIVDSAKESLAIIKNRKTLDKIKKSSDIIKKL